MEHPQDRYIREHSSALPEALSWIERQTNIHTNYPRMLSGSVQGQLLKMLVELSGARKVIEIGTFTGYSACCMALGLPEDGHIDALEINDELAGLIRSGWQRAGVEQKITLRIGDARETLQQLQEAGARYDFAFVDANKREYVAYFDALFPMMDPGSLILVDDTLWDGEVYADPLPGDAQTRGLLAFNDMVASRSDVEVVMLPLRDGLTLVRKL